ncbi:MAG: alginate export family protein [Saccharospirillaceae bacterium]|nr:alginate export family protein [Saccharospirillaceae bacterium]MCD8530287.1 alginate export family protein [Saccharospirillaceae bacterium]
MEKRKTLIAAALGLAASQIVFSQSVLAENRITDTLKQGDVIADLRLRYESADDDDAADKDSASALTLRSRLGYETADLNGFKALYEIEDVRAVIDDYAPENTDYDTVADPENTEINRAQISYSKDGFSVVAGRQRIILDNARFVGNVGWRQNEQTFDAIKAGYKTGDLNIQYAYIDQVNGILRRFDADVTSHLFNAAYSGLKAGTLTGYAYLLKDDDSDAKLDTYGARFAGKTAVNDLNLIYSAELATQSSDDFDAGYYALEGGVVLSGITLALGNETLGSDEGAYGFQTPLATKHAFNGWADKFLVTPADGLSDTYVKVAGAVAGIKLLAMYHDYSAVKGSDDKGSEVNFLAAKGFSEHYSAGLKYAAYSAGDTGTNSDKAWLWLEAKF